MRHQVLVFPLAILLNSFTMTGLLLVFGLLGHAELAADIGVVQGATLALFYAFSANARNVILARPDRAVIASLLWTRLSLVVPLAAMSLVLAIGFGSASPWIAAAMVLRRACEWIGELAIAAHERDGRTRPIQVTIVAELVCITGCIVATLGGWAPLSLAALPWALVPVLAAVRMPLERVAWTRSQLTELLPHFGSTAVIGVGVFVFRTSIVILVGKAAAGDLFTAFALGGLLPTIFGQALAPSIAHRYGTRAWSPWLLAIPFVMLLAAAGIGLLVAVKPDWLLFLGRSQTFGYAVALSVAGGAVMLVALALRTRLIHDGGGDSVFGPDLLANILIATGVPFVFFTFGPQALGGLYLLNALISLAFLIRVRSSVTGVDAAGLILVVTAALVFPVFFQLSGGLFRSNQILFDAQGHLSQLPLPLSVIAVFAGIALIGAYGSATRTLSVLFFAITLMVLSSLLVAQDDLGPKLILLAQFILPMFGLVLGEMLAHARPGRTIEWVFLGVVATIVPLQLLSMWLSGSIILVPNALFFSIYQHLQYVPTIMVALMIIGSLALWGRSRSARLMIAVLWPLVCLYTTASASITALLYAAVGMLALCVATRASEDRGWAIAAAAAALLSVAVHLALGTGALASLSSALDYSTGLTVAKKLAFVETDGVTASQAPAGVMDRLTYWRFYATGIMSDAVTFLFGHAAPPDRRLVPSAHNYLLDFVYNFGAIAAAPLVVLLVDTMRLAWRRRNEIMSDPALMGTVLATGMLMAENLIKVGLRQPYPGIITFFLWGLLLARLVRLSGRPSHP